MKESGKGSLSVFWAVLAAALYAVNAPVAKLLLEDVEPAMMAGLLYLGAGAGMLLLGIARRGTGRGGEEKRLTRSDLPYTAGMIALDIAAPVFLMFGLTMTTSANASLLNNFEIVATSVVAFFIFKEKISRRLGLAVGLITLSSMLLSFEDMSSLDFSAGSLLVLAACVCWGFENNCTRMLSRSDPLEIVAVKGLGSGMGAMLIALLSGEHFPALSDIPLVLLLGFVSYGLSIFFYVYAQRCLGAARTSAYYGIAPFIGVLFSFLIFGELPGGFFPAAFVIMVLGAYLATEKIT